MLYICNKCEQPCEIEEIYSHSTYDDAYGISKWSDWYEEVSECCGAGYEEWDEDNFADTFGEDALEDALLL